MWPCLLLKYCACDGVVSCQSTAPATGLSFWNVGPAALRDLLNTARSPAAMLRQCEMDWSCHMLLYSVPQQHCRRGVGVRRCPRKNYRRKNAGSHGGEAVAAIWYVLYFARETEHIEGRKSACALKLRSHTGHVSSFWTAGFHESNGYLGWWSSPAFFGFRSFSLDVYYIDSSLALSSFHYVLRPRRGLGQASVSLGAPRMPTNLLHHGPQNRAEKSAQNMAAIEGPRQ